MKNSEIITIYILCYNRPEFAKQAIISVLGQTCPKFELIVSDHSSNDQVAKMIKESFPGVRYIRRSPTLMHLEHFNLCIEEVQTDYYCLFHDDDLMGAQFVEGMHDFICDHPNAAAFASNAYIEVGGKIEKRLAFLSPKEYVSFNGPRKLAERYFSRNQSGIAPNPSYVYSRHIAGNQKFLVDGGKYADVSLLLDIAQQGEIIWINRPLMTYRMHGNNLGSIESLPDRIRFLAYLKRHRSILGNEILQDYRCSFIYKRVIKIHAWQRRKRYVVANSFLNFYHCYHYSRLSTYKTLWARAVVKWGFNDLR